MDIKYFASCLEELGDACVNIKEEKLCSECPMNSCCIEETNFGEIIWDTPQDIFKEMLKMGESPSWYIKSDDEKLEIAHQCF